MSSCRRSYTAAEKLTVIQYAEAHGNRAAEREFDGGISEMNIHQKPTPMYRSRFLFSVTP